ncbi:uncharacterized protein BO95DRAFT_484230 [Aspergillus brunneoviolaceus CBS 621.78]|uniref:Uncharacterized protein n=1 Tax=Aspergillus brunneoviolaceus CBS 621.78 TaxID=1450534 RepID=A0ACD1G1W7_9EURO|nr:hypothetical protein BO95DRAFT_484230 [Aspergillus brunneoviolaceus CBS 621.78]RAH43221.1 hypothetical protein BO95DRAFT_484230 [Aspergillus brunneoviolaceus CBS 621.78]
MDLQPPSVLAQLPRPLHASTGKTHIGDVFSLAESKKRKRHEVVVAADGEAVNIYNIQTPKLVTSYAVPPQSSFTCQPCSVRRKIPSKSVVRRQTYIALKQQIKAFVEESGGNGSSAPVISSSSYSVSDSDSPVNFVGIVPGPSTEQEPEGSFDILAVHQDGRVRRLSPDLKTQRWSMEHSEVAKISSTHSVNACFLVEFEDAKKSLLKRRQDLTALALGSLTDSGVDEPSILLVVSHPNGSDPVKLSDVKVQMFSVPSDATLLERSIDESQKMRHLLTISIPEVSGQETIERQGSQWYFHSGSAGLNLSFPHGHINFDLSQYAPTLTSKFILENETFSSIMRISPQSVIGAGQSMIAVYDTQYQSIQRSIAVSDVPASGSSSVKAPTTFVSYFARLGVALATKNNTLLAFDLSSSSLAGGPLKRPRDGLLIDAIGRGIGPSYAQSDLSSKKLRTEDAAVFGLTAKQTVRWTQLTNDLRECVKSNNASAFDTAVQRFFGAGESKTLPGPGKFVNSELTLFLLTLIFSLKEENNTQTSKDTLSAPTASRLSIAIWPERTCQWLINIGHLSQANVEIALRRSIKPRILQPLPVGSFVQGLVDSDPTLQRLNSVLSGRVVLSTNELAYALRLFLDKARSSAIILEEARAKLLTSGETQPDHDEEMSDSPADPSTNSDSNALVTTTTTTTPTEPATLHNIYKGLNTTLHILHTHPPATLTTALRSALTRSELISMVHHLRLCLATSGHTTRFTENPPTPISPDQTNPALPLDTITTCLNAAIDAIGPSGWIAAAASPGEPLAENSQELIADIKSEISAALAGVEEATYLTGILREYLRYTNSVKATTAAVTTTAVAETAVIPATEQPVTPANVRYEKLNGADLVIFGAGDGEEGGAGGEAAGGKLLPLSLKAAAHDVSKTKVKKETGEVKARSSREIGYLRRKAVGKYSFERLFV